MTIANCFTILRIILVPVFVYTLYKYPVSSSVPGIIFIICIVTDILDGLIARTFNTRTQLGASLDPLADKFLVLSSYFVLTWLNKLPVWLFIITLGRDIILIFGILMIFLLTGSAKIKSRISGKITFIFQTLSIFFVLFKIPHELIIFYITSISAIISVSDYCIKGAKQIICLQ